jgi:hypothetical protein
VPPPRPLPERFWEKVEKTDECWIWTAKLDAKGYGLIWIPEDRAPRRAHRISYLMTVGPIPEGYVVHHECGVRRCVRPSHLEAMEPSEHNAKEHNYPARTVCSKGHALSPENTRIRRVWANGRPYGARICRKCAAEYARYRRSIGKT